ncbi:uncharacterized protein BXIN_2174 [Babesia sp. Xinjiang]|uniref:uncharacterized protein n=1 Tax=Babesia sp. Xinjiang TaxID=462227 RepID=UPI000A220D2D|nr:uncharacterized protein BXIN_2174 [Babesia sp. Xinjiang]ORM40421.1 hypothetical protein BXIN_2174 [Babesia sp. Xinjiang]
MEEKNTKLRRPHTLGDSAERTDTTDNMVKMVAVYREDGGIKAFVPVDSFDSRTDEVMESSCDELTAKMCKGGNNAGSVGWINQAIARLNGERARHCNMESAVSNTSVASVTNQTMPDDVQQHVHAHYVDGQEDLQEQGNLIIGDHDESQAAMCSRQTSETISQAGSISIPAAGEYNTCEYMDARPGVSVTDMTEVEGIITTILDAKLSSYVEKCEMQIEAVRSEQEKMMRQAIDDVLKQVDGRITEMCSQLEHKFTDLLSQNNQNDKLDDRIKTATQEAKKEMETSMLEDVDSKIKHVVTVVKKALHSQSSDVEKQLENIMLAAAENESKMQSISDAMEKKLESKLREQSENSEEFTKFKESVKTELGDTKAKNIQYYQKVKELVTQIEALNSDVESVDSKLHKYLTEEIDGLTKKIDTELSDVVNKRELDDAIDDIRNLCDAIEKKAVGVAAQECDEKLGVWAMDMEDKMSQDLYRIIEDRMQDLSASLLKQLGNSVDQKLRGLGEALKEENASDTLSKPSDSAGAETTAAEVDTVIKGLKSAIKTHVENAVLQRISAFSTAKSSTPSDTRQGEVDNDTLESSEVSGGWDSVVKRFTDIMEQCDKQLGEATEVTSRLQELNEQAMAIVEQMRKYIGLANDHLEELPKSTEETSEIIKDLYGTIGGCSSMVSDTVQSVSGDAVWNRRSQTHSSSSGPTASYVAQNIVNVKRETITGTIINKPQIEKEKTNIFSGILCGFSVPHIRKEGTDNRSATEPMELRNCTANRKTPYLECERSFTEPSNNVEVKYVNMNGQVIKVTQEHFNLNQLSGRPPIITRTDNRTGNSTHRSTNFYY